jgi:cell division protein FtsN
MFMPLYARTPRRTLDHYDPKQRLVGGIVLCLIILLIYFILKILIGLSAVHDGRYRLASAKEDEVLKSTAAAVEQSTTHRVVGNDGVNTITTLPKPLRPLPLNFTFLDLDGNPMSKEVLAIEEEQAASAKTQAITDVGWIVQAGVFKTEGSAKRRVDKLKEKGFESAISKVGNRFVVNLMPMQPDKAAAQKLSKQVTAQAGFKHLKIRENKPPQSP